MSLGITPVFQSFIFMTIYYFVCRVTNSSPPCSKSWSRSSILVSEVIPHTPSEPSPPKYPYLIIFLLIWKKIYSIISGQVIQSRSQILFLTLFPLRPQSAPSAMNCQHVGWPMTVIPLTGASPELKINNIIMLLISFAVGSG